jgi:hypothetical protein
MCRGQSRQYPTLLPLIDRELKGWSRQEVLKRERRSIRVFQSRARLFSHPGEELALTDDLVALMILRHYGVPTRLLDWSASPHIAAHFAVCDNGDEHGEIWAFDYSRYVRNGARQWRRWPETTADRSGDPDRFKAQLTAFKIKKPPNWFICAFYPEGFARQNAQAGAYTATARFGLDHKKAIRKLLRKKTSHHRYVVPARIKKKLKKVLRNEFGIWDGSLFGDIAAAADAAWKAFPGGFKR